MHPPPPCACCCCHRLCSGSRFDRVCTFSPGIGSNLTEIPVVAPKAHFRPVPTLATGGSNENVPFRIVEGQQARFAYVAPPPRSPTPRASSRQSINGGSQTGPMRGKTFQRPDRDIVLPVKPGCHLLHSTNVSVPKYSVIEAVATCVKSSDPETMLFRPARDF